MSKLNDIVDIGGAKPKEKIIADIKDFIVELIDEVMPYIAPARESKVPKKTRDFANERMLALRNRVKEI